MLQEGSELALFLVPGGFDTQRNKMSVEAVGPVVVAVAQVHGVELHTLRDIGLRTVTKLGAQGPGMKVGQVPIRGGVVGTGVVLSNGSKVA